MLRFLGAATIVIVSAALVATALLLQGGDPRWVVDVLHSHGGDTYAVGYLGLLLAPVLLVLAAVVVRRAVWVWIGAVTVHLAAQAAALVRLEHWMPGWAWPAMLVVVLVSLWSVAEALLLPGHCDSSSSHAPIR